MDGEKKVRLFAIIKDTSFKYGNFTLSSGKTSHFYFDLRMTTNHPEAGPLVGFLILQLIRELGLEPDAIGGMESGAIPISSHVQAAAYYHQLGIKTFYVRKEVKGHGTKKRVEGWLEEGAGVVIVEDVSTTGASAMAAIEAVVAEKGARVLAVISILSRQEGAEELYAEKGIAFYPLFVRSDFGEGE